MLSVGLIGRLFSTKALYEAHRIEPKTLVELRMIKASAFIRSTPEWAEQLNDEEKCLEWTTQVMGTFNLTDKEVEYVFDELKYYVLLKENGVAGEELGAIDYMWITNAGSNCELADEFKHNSAVLEYDSTKAESAKGKDAPLAGLQALVDPFLYPLDTKESCILDKPVESPGDSLNIELPRVKPGCLEAWYQAIKDFNSRQSNSGAKFDKREVSQLVDGHLPHLLDELLRYWLPTDFNVNDDGSVTIRSYINNLHPVHHAALYQSISKIFAKCVPLLEQVATDMIHPRKFRAEFSPETCVTSSMIDPYVILDMAKRGEEIPEKYRKYITTWRRVSDNSGKREVCLNTNAFSEINRYAEEDVYSDPIPEPFSLPERPLKPYSMRGMPLQASVEMSSILLTPENPTHPMGEWQAVGIVEERIFAVGLYFYDVENIASAKLKFRDPMGKNNFVDPEYLCAYFETDNADSELTYECDYSQEVGEVEIKSGSYICYPNFYETKMPAFELMDPTRPGHVKYIAFYIVDPAQRLVSTEIVPPQQPHWTC
ncbi:hypothetical protein GGI24_000452 [Coemansia furcata]|nr:hypothetical protein GGI24_000452 [Coemansia furcata]